ncbi:MAG: hypothetical protein J6Y90_04755 [Lachnospiraceae bacterium]|nr:hypothetical protein [Lachnospiraceae bacterium]
MGQYLSEQGITGPVKLWITGYSRGGAVANLVGGELDNWSDMIAILGEKGFIDEQSEEAEAINYYVAGFDLLKNADISFTKEDIYVYCFEPPAGRLISEDRTASADDTKVVQKNEEYYGNIFNIVNPNDLVIYSVPAAYGFGRYGIDLCLPVQGVTDGYDEMEEKVSEIYDDLDSGGEYLDEDFRMKKLDVRWKLARKGRWINVTPALVVNDMDNQMSQGAFLLDYMTFFAKDIVGSRQRYASVYEDELRELTGTIFGGTEEQNEIFAKSLAIRAQNHVGTAARTYRNYLLLRLLRGSADRTMLWQLVSDWLNTSMTDAGFEDYSPEIVDRAGKDLSPLMSQLVIRRINYFVTFMENIELIGWTHMPELCFAWLTSMDSNYFPGAEPVFDEGGFGKVMAALADQAGEYEYPEDADVAEGDEEESGAVAEVDPIGTDDETDKATSTGTDSGADETTSTGADSRADKVTSITPKIRKQVTTGILSRILKQKNYIERNLLSRIMDFDWVKRRVRR